MKVHIFNQTGKTLFVMWPEPAWGYGALLKTGMNTLTEVGVDEVVRIYIGNTFLSHEFTQEDEAFVVNGLEQEETAES